MCVYASSFQFLFTRVSKIHSRYEVERIDSLHCLSRLPRALHEADITIAEPADIDDEQLTSTEVRNTITARTKIHRFVTMCRLCRILSRVMDVLYTHNKRKQASIRIEQMNRLCCEHLLDQLDFS